jgi:hypothetical protein
LRFRARHGDVRFEGALFAQLDAEGLIAQWTMMVRPLRALAQLAEAMRATLEPELLRAHGR